MNYDYKLVITKMMFNGGNFELCILLNQRNRPLEIHAGSLEAPSLVGNIYVARVSKVMPQMNAAFLQAGDLVFYYPISHVESAVFSKKNGKAETLCQGDELLVQVVRDAIKTKEICVTTNLSFTGEYAVVTTGDKKLGISKKITGSKREELKTFLNGLEDKNYGKVIRSAGQNTDVNTIKQEIEKLSEAAEKTLETGRHKVCGTLVKQGEHPFFSHIRRLSKEYESLEIVSDDADWILALKSTFAEKIPIAFYNDADYSLQQLYAIDNLLKKTLDKKVYLPSGGYLLIEPTETLTVIDVNSGKNLKHRSREAYFEEINEEAAGEIAKQIRLRNISGMILVDFINMENEKSIDKLMQTIKNHTKEDYVKVSVLDYTKLGLVEITRAKKYPSLMEYLKTER